jgi:hypothetical protein
MGFNLWWVFNDGIGGHAWLSLDEMRALRGEMIARGMAWEEGAEPAAGRQGIPAGKLLPADRERITPREIEEALAAEPGAEPELADAALWRDWLAFLEGARHKGGILIRG